MTPAEAQSLAVSAFEPQGGDLIDPPVLMPAARPLDVSGEAVRSRLCVFTDAGGGETAMRPDLTLPVAETEAQRLVSGGPGEQVYRYAARAFRLPAWPGQPVEFVQVGFERFGAPVDAETDAGTFSAVMAAIGAAGAPVERILLGDLAVFDAYVQAMDLPAGTSEALRRAFRLQGGVESLLSDRADNGNTASLVHKDTSQGDAERLVEQMLNLSGAPLVGGRSVADIATRLREKAAQGTSDGLTETSRAVLREVIAVNGAPTACVDELAAIAKAHGLTGLTETLNVLSDRVTLLAHATGDANVTFDASFGRRFNYYDGFVFEIFPPGAPDLLPMGAGGRYDSLIDRLSQGAVSASGIGGVVRPERLAAAAEGQS